MTQQIISGEMKIMKKLGLILLALTITSSAFADEMRTVLVQGTKINCSNDNKPVAENSNLQVAIPESALDGISTLSWGDVELNRNVNVKIGNRACTLPKGAVLEKAVIQIFCTEGSVLKFMDGSTGEWYEERLSDDSKARCGGNDYMFKRIAVEDLTLKQDQYFVKVPKPIFMSDSVVQYNGKIDPVGKVNFFTAKDMKFKVPYVTGSYEPSKK